MTSTRSSKKRIAILGGSFNPMHCGHAAMVSAARKSLNPDEIWLMPARKPPHKPGYENVSDDDRVSMLKAYAEDYEDVLVCTEELEMEGFTYTCNTLTILSEKYPDNEYWFIIGGDSVVDFHKWYHPEIILEKAGLGVCCRNEHDNSVLQKVIDRLREFFGGKYCLLDFEPVDVSSTMIRERVKDGKTLAGLVPDKIAKYIEAHGLYGAAKESNKEDIYSDEMLEYFRKEMEKTLSSHRYQHSLGVMQTSAELAQIYGADVRKAEIAGILHDCAKQMAPSEMENLCVQNDVILNVSELGDDYTKSALLHSKAGMVLARNVYNIEDKEILDAIYYHTVGRPAMSLLEKIVFVADFIEPGRTQRSETPLSVLREMVKTELDKAVYLICDNTVKYLESLGRNIDEATLKTRDYYKKYV